MTCSRACSILRSRCRMSPLKSATPPRTHGSAGCARSTTSFKRSRLVHFVDEIADAKNADSRDVWLELIGPREQDVAV